MHKGIRLLLSAGLAALWVVGAAAANAAALPDGLSQAASISAGEQAAIDAFVRDQAGPLADAAPSVREGARDALLRPLRPPKGEPSQAFRFAYSKALAPYLAPLVPNKDAGIAFGALRIAGAIASDTGFLALKQGLEDPRPAVRRMAAAGLGETLAAVASGSAALTVQRVADALDLLQGALARETDILVADGIVIALTEPPPGAAIRTNAMTALAKGLAPQIALRRALKSGADEIVLGVYVRATTSLRDELIRQIPTPTGVAAPLAVASGIAGGQAIVFALQQLGDLKARPGPPPLLEDTSLDDLASVAEAVALLSEQARTRQRLESKVKADFDAAIRGGPADRAREDVLFWVGPGGVLTRPPYSVPTGDFTSGL